jgi:uncharacterized protein (TIGR02145 family)
MFMKKNKLFNFIFGLGIILFLSFSCKTEYPNEPNNLQNPTITTVKDIEGNIYHTIVIGNQTWMIENLKTTKYRNGDLIGTTNPINKDISNETTPKYQWAYNGDENNIETYGRLYTWYTVNDSRKIAPLGWHVATDSEWTVLQNYLITNGYNFDNSKTENKIAKSLSATTNWSLDTYVGAVGNDLSKNNSSGFNALPAGYRFYQDGTFIGLNGFTIWWTSSEQSNDKAWYRAINYGSIGLVTIYSPKNQGYSIRCIKD